MFVPYVELADGRVVVATDGADEIIPAADGKSVRARWKNWSVVGTKSGTLADVGLVSEVVWRIENGTISREETLSSTQPVTVRRWQIVVPSSYGKVVTETSNGARVDRFSSAEGTLAAQLSGATFPVNVSIVASGNGPLGRGVQGAIPLHLVFEAHDLIVQSGKPLKYKLSLTVGSGK